MLCPKCGVMAPEGAKFCEEDGTRLVPIEIEPKGSVVPVDPVVSTTPVPSVPVAAVRCRCGAEASAIDAQGYCEECGRFCGTRERDHIEVVFDARFAGVTDRGRRHTQNEDDMALARVVGDPSTSDPSTSDPSILEAVSPNNVAHIMVVCDGVSSSEHGEQASRTGCLTARDHLQKFVEEGSRATSEQAEDAMRAAIKAANTAVCALPHTANSAKDPPEATIVAALVQFGVATIGWVGDSRAYWFGVDFTLARALTHDHSWINDVVDAGTMSEAEAEASPGAHAITRCLGVPDADNEDGTATEPGIVRFEFPGAGMLLLCSDGLWNYASHGEDIAALLKQMPPESDADAITQARHLVDFANGKGGRDNITVAIAKFE